MLRQRPPTTAAEPVATNFDTKDVDENEKSKELFLDEGDQTEMVQLLRKLAGSQQNTIERVQGGFGVAAAVVALILPFLSGFSTSSLVWSHAIYTAALVLFVSNRLTKRSQSTDSTKTKTYPRRLAFFILSSLPMATWISAFIRRERHLEDPDLDKQQQQFFRVHLCLSLISLFIFGGALRIDLDTQSIERALDELEASQYPCKSL